MGAILDMVDECPKCRCTEKVFVHGHTQCANCKCNIDECCQGETEQKDG